MLGRLVIAWFTLVVLAGVPACAFAQSAATARDDEAPAWVDPGWRRTRAAHDVAFEADGTSTATYTFEIAALDDRGARAIAQQSFDYNGYYESVTLEGLATVKRDGRVLPIDERAVGDQPRSTDASVPYFDEQRAKLVAFPDVAPGDAIRGRVTVVARRSRFAGEFEHAWLQSPDQPPGTMTVTVTGPTSRPLRVHATGAAVSREQRGDRAVVRAEFVHAAPRATSGLDGFDAAARLEVSTFADYGALARAVHARNAPMARPDAAVAALARGIVGGTVGTRDKVERLHDWVAQNIRYVGIGVEDGGWTARPAAETLAARYGDCKAHATLLKALLAAEGIEAHLVLVNAGPRYRLTEVATANFDHAITYVPALDAYLDPTASGFAFGALPPGLHGKPVLDVDRGALATIPPMRADEFLVDTRTDYALHPDGRRAATTTVTGTGVGATLARSVAGKLEGVDRARRARELLEERAGFKGSGTYAFPNPRLVASRFAITAAFEIDTPVDVAARQKLRVLPLTSPLPHPSALLTREAGDYVCLPLTLRDEASLALPPGVNVYQRPGKFAHEAALEGETAYGHASGRVRATHESWIDGRTLRTRSALEVSFDAAVCPQSFADAVRAGLARFDEFQREAIGLTNRPVARVIEGGSAYQRGLAAHDARAYGQALALWTPIAEAGDAGAQYRIGLLHRDGLGVARDPGEAHLWFARAAEGGDTDAQIALAHQFEVGSGIAADFEAAARWYGRAIEGGAVEANRYLAHLYEGGVGGRSDPERAIALYRRADEGGVPLAASGIGFLYESGRGVERDYAAAARWYRKDADRGEAYAQMHLGYLYAQGLGVERDYAAATAWYRKAAEQGDTVAEYNLGWIYESGSGTPRNVAEALVWYQRAAAKGNSMAVARMGALAGHGRRGGLLSQAYRWLRTMVSL